MRARDFGVTEDPYEAADEEAGLYRLLSPEDRYARLLDLMALHEAIRRTIEPARRARMDRILDELEDPGSWWERVPSR